MREGVGMSSGDWGAGKPSVAVLLIATVLSAHEARHAIEASGARLVATVDLAMAASTLADYPDADVLMLEAEGADAETLGAALDAVADRALLGTPVIVGFAPDQLDQVAAAMLGHQVQLLCGPSAADRAAALAIARAGRPSGVVREEDPDTESARLKRLNDEVARIVELLARVGRAPVSAPGLGDRTTPFGAEDDAAPIAAADVRRAIRVRRLRDQFFGSGLFEDPAWDMLLDLFAADLEGVRVSVSSLCIAAAVPPTTALRWIARMTEAGLLEREPDPGDRRRAFMLLSPGVRTNMRRYWQAMRRLGGQLV